MSKHSQAGFAPWVRTYGLPYPLKMVGPSALAAITTDLDHFIVPPAWKLSRNGYGYVLTDAVLSVSGNAHTGGTTNFVFQLIANDDATNGILYTFTLATAFGRAAPRGIAYDLRDANLHGIPLLPNQKLRLDCTAVPTDGTLNAGLANVRLHLGGLMFGLSGAN